MRGIRRTPSNRRAAGLALAAAALAAVAMLAPGASATPAAGSAELAYVTATATSPATVWVANSAGGEARAIGEGNQPRLSPDGELVAVSLSGVAADPETGPALGLIPVAGGPIRSYLSLAGGYAEPLAWSPDGRYLAVAFQSNAVGDPAAGSGLVIVDTTTGAATMIATGIVYGASFDPSGSDRVVYGISQSQELTSAVNLYVAAAPGGGVHRLTHNGRSLYPLWGARGIIYDREHLRSLAPEYQLWLAPNHGRTRQLTHVRVPSLLVGLQPIAISANGSHLLAEWGGEDTSEAWTVTLPSGHARRLRLPGRHFAEGAGISTDGTTLLVDVDALEVPQSSAHIALVPFVGGAPRVIVAHGAEAGWTE